MKKIIPVIMCGALIASMAAMTGCGSFQFSTSNTETYNGISRTVTKTGDSKEEVVYTDENGNTLDQAKGEAAFKAAKAEVDGAGSVDYRVNVVDDGNTNTTVATTTKTTDTETVKDATLTIANDSDDDFTEMYFTTSDSDDWGDNLLHDGAVFVADSEGSIPLNYYNPNASYKMCLVNSDGDEDEIDFISFSHVDNPQDLTVRIDGEGGFYMVEVD